MEEIENKKYSVIKILKKNYELHKKKEKIKSPNCKIYKSIQIKTK